MNQRRDEKTGARVRGSGLVKCYACSGTFTLGYAEEGSELCALHSQPYCAAFNAIDTVDDAVKFSERCWAAEQPS